jgi:hypothetical protein
MVRKEQFYTFSDGRTVRLNLDLREATSFEYDKTWRQAIKHIKRRRLRPEDIKLPR